MTVTKCDRCGKEIMPGEKRENVAMNGTILRDADLCECCAKDMEEWIFNTWENAPKTWHCNVCNGAAALINSDQLDSKSRTKRRDSKFQKGEREDEST